MSATLLNEYGMVWYGIATWPFEVIWITVTG